eukprot:TRINITY_DN57843_c0_g1_i1.p1 TRINITY_DN57843_c0_g1~~TRINITY_DN57843_c0_g1_i1.p1  ORF type:complete len:188 (-),score=21.18 TRINITY_DN57843_c0_g1_i1:258-821(-)
MVRQANGNVFGESSVVTDALLGVRPAEADAAAADVKNSGPALLPQLIDLHPRFQDFGEFPVGSGTMVPLLKLSKLTVISLQAAFPAMFPHTSQLELLSVCPDYQVPRALRELGVLIYSPSLANSIDTRVALAPGGIEEVEIRLGCMIAAEALRRSMGASVSTIDFVLWSYGRAGCKLPHHYCVTQMY